MLIQKKNLENCSKRHFGKVLLFVSFKLKKANCFFEVKIIFKDLIERLNHPKENKFEHELFELLSQNKIVEIEGVGRVWFNQGLIFCVNN